MAKYDEVIQNLLAEIKRLNKNLESTKDDPDLIDTRILEEADVFDTREFIPKYRQSTTPTEFICGGQGQLGITEYGEDGEQIAQIFLNQYELALLKKIIRYKY